MNLLRIYDESVVIICLKCLQAMFVFLNGLDYLKNRSQLFLKLIELSSHSSLEVKKNLLSILISLCKCLNGAFEMINKATINLARRTN